MEKDNQTRVHTGTTAPPRALKPVIADNVDRLFSWLMFPLGFAFIYIVSSIYLFVGVKLFTVAFAGFVICYFFCKKVKPARESYFWLIILIVLGLSFATWGIIPAPLQFNTLILIAAYWVFSMGGCLLEKGKSSQWIVIDGINCLICTPFLNFLCHAKVILSRDTSEKDKKTSSYALSILLGLVMSIPILLIAVNLLKGADYRFADVIDSFSFNIHEHVYFFIIRAVLSIPVTMYLFGLIFGSLHRRNTDSFNKDSLTSMTMGFHIIPNMASYTVLTLTCLLYLLFIGLQSGYFFSAFFRDLPEAYSYAEYARQGFFELCMVAVLNLGVLIGANCFSKNPRSENKVLRIMNIILSILTLLIIATAMSKMILYITAYGFTEKRILTVVFMVWLVIVFVLLIIWQFKKIQIVKMSLITGTVLYTLLCVLPVKEWISMGNEMFFS